MIGRTRHRHRVPILWRAAVHLCALNLGVGAASGGAGDGEKVKDGFAGGGGSTGVVGSDPLEALARRSSQQLRLYVHWPERPCKSEGDGGEEQVRSTPRASPMWIWAPPEALWTLRALPLLQPSSLLAAKGSQTASTVGKGPLSEPAHLGTLALWRKGTGRAERQSQCPCRFRQSSHASRIASELLCCFTRFTTRRRSLSIHGEDATPSEI